MRPSGKIHEMGAARRRRAQATPADAEEGGPRRRRAAPRAARSSSARKGSPSGVPRPRGVLIRVGRALPSPGGTVFGGSPLPPTRALRIAGAPQLRPHGARSLNLIRVLPDATNTATRSRGKTMSGLTLMLPARTSRSLRKRSPSRCSCERSRCSGLVSKRRLAFIRPLTPALDGTGYGRSASRGIAPRVRHFRGAFALTTYPEAASACNARSCRTLSSGRHVTVFCMLRFAMNSQSTTVWSDRVAM